MAGAARGAASGGRSVLRRSGVQRSTRINCDAIAELYDSTPHREKSVDPELITFLAGRVTTAALTLLDIACGTGNQQIANRGLTPNGQFVGLDGSLESCARRGAKCRISPGSTATARRCHLPRAASTSSVANTPSTISATRRACCARPFACCGAAAGSRSTILSAGVRRLAVLRLFPGGETRDFADFWPPNAIVSELNATGFAGVEVARRHVHRERDLAELLSALQFRERNSQLLSLSDAAYEAGLRRIERDLDNPQRPKVRSDHLCFVTVRGDRG